MTELEQYMGDILDLARDAREIEEAVGNVIIEDEETLIENLEEHEDQTRSLIEKIKE